MPSLKALSSGRLAEVAARRQPAGHVPSVAGLLAVIAVALWLFATGCRVVHAQQLSVQCNANRAFDYLEQVCRIGPRISGSDGMLRQQQLIIEHFQKFGCEIRAQSFDAAHPLNGGPVRMTNLIVSWNPRAKERVLLCCHYDTRPYPDRDFLNPRGTFIGANDGASGVALFMELGHHLRQIQPVYGVDFVFFDGEEFVYSNRDKYFLGSEYFATWYRDHPPEYRYLCGVLVDMVGGKRLRLYQERNSVRLAGKVTQSVWDTAKRMGVREFIPRVKHEVRDDHLPLNLIARIPTCDVIDFDYSAWHTTKDLPSACSGESLATVGNVLLQWLTEVPINE